MGIFLLEVNESLQALQSSNEPLMATDEAFRAVVGQAFSSFRPIEVRMDQMNNKLAGDGQN